VTGPVDLSLVVPCLNEERNLPELVARVEDLLRAAPFSGELVLVDDGSSDATWPVIERLRSERPFVRAARHVRRLGIAAAWHTGLEAARGDAVCVLDADLQYDPADVPRLWAAREQTGADIVQGWRSSRERPRDGRLLLSRALGALLNAAFGMSLRDNKSGFFLCRKQVLADLLQARARYRHFQCFVMVAARDRGYRIAEVEAAFRPRHAGRSAFGRVPLRPTLEVLVDLVSAVRRRGRA
jgi:phenylacetate-CoA ligase